MKTIQKYAYIPTLVNTWRNTQAWIWLQSYYVGKVYDEKQLYCLSLGFFSKEV